MSEIKQGKCEECGKNYEEILTICGHCGYTHCKTTISAEADPYWKCGKCSRTVQAKVPPKKCPGCGEVCDFKNITCYDPSCGGPGNVDPRL